MTSSHTLGRPASAGKQQNLILLLGRVEGSNSLLQLAAAPSIPHHALQHHHAPLLYSSPPSALVKPLCTTALSKQAFNASQHVNPGQLLKLNGHS
jgi:hypothetical protein